METSTQNVLIVEDDQDLRESLKIGFSRKGFGVLTAVNGADALRQLEKQPINVLLTDIRMPEMTGIELMKKITGAAPEKPVVICLSGFTDLKINDAFDMGADAFFQKPVSCDILVAASQHFIQQQREKKDSKQMFLSLQKKVEQIECKAVLGRMVWDIAQGLSQPVSIMQGYAGMIHEALASIDQSSNLMWMPKISDYAKKIESMGDEVLKTISSLTQAYLEDSQKEVCVQVDLRKMINDVLQLFIPSFKHYGIECTFDSESPLPLIKGFPKELFKVFLYSLGNAVHSIKEMKKPWILIETNQNSHEIRIILSTPEPDLPEPCKESGASAQIMDFEKAAQFSLIRTIMANHGGSISCENILYSTRISLCFPVLPMHH